MASYDSYPFKRWIKWGAIILVVVILFFSGVSSYNGVMSADQKVQSQWSMVENRMQERADKITSLVEVVKGYTKHEEKVFSDIAAARAALTGSGDIQSKLDANDKMTTATKDMLVLVENYPDLKASQQFHDLNAAIDEVENKISIERKRFIEDVQQYNVKVKTFPGSIFARAMGFTEKDYFKADSNAAEPPKINFD